MHAVSDPTQVDDPEYALGIREAVVAGITYAIEALESGRRAEDPVPFALLTQARAASRNGIGLDTVLRRYSAAYTSFGDHLIEAAEDCEVSSAELKLALQIQAAACDRFMAAISTEHAREAEARLHSSGKRRAELVRALLAGGPADPSELHYPFEAWHLAAVATGPGVEGAARDIATALDRRLLIVLAGEKTAWIWFGGQSRMSTCDALSQAGDDRLRGLVMAFGEPAWGIEGWRFSHRQAQAAMSIARRKIQSVVCYADVSLLASMLQDEVLTRSLHDLYISPLAGLRDGGQALRLTLKTYFALERNISSAAAALGVSRKTVNKRLRLAEELLSCPLGQCASELEAALQLAEVRGDCAPLPVPALKR